MSQVPNLWGTEEYANCRVMNEACSPMSFFASLDHTEAPLVDEVKGEGEEWMRNIQESRTYANPSRV